MANEEYVKETFKPDKLWACKSVTESAFPGITPPEEGGGGGMYQIGEDLNFTPGAYSDGIFAFGSVNGDAFRDAEYKAGAYVVNKGYVFNYIGDSGKQHVFVNVRNASSLPGSGAVDYTEVDIACEVLAFWQQNDYDDYISWMYTCMPRGSDINDNTIPSHKNIKVNGVEFYCGEYTTEIASSKVYKHILSYKYTHEGLNLQIDCPVYSAKSNAYTALEAGTRISLLDTGYVYSAGKALMLCMRGFTTSSKEMAFFPTEPYFATNLKNGETLKIETGVRMTLITDTVFEA